ncbi:MAG: hypothetical protein WCJ64_23235 [Rhodospirillaceae bacterium]
MNLLLGIPPQLVRDRLLRHATRLRVELAPDQLGDIDEGIRQGVGAGFVVVQGGAVETGRLIIDQHPHVGLAEADRSFEPVVAGPELAGVGTNHADISTVVPWWFRVISKRLRSGDVKTLTH